MSDRTDEDFSNRGLLMKVSIDEVDSKEAQEAISEYR